MCGICGKLNFDQQEPVDLELLRQMMDLIYHRGPDGCGEYRSGPVGLGHRRLSIIDLKTGNQPMSNEDGTVWIVYNGEVYNFPELRAGLEARGHRFKSTSDTEVIIHLYEELGGESVTHFRGMFAFAIWDDRKQSLLLARDRVGIKPLYYTNTGKTFLFASEIKSILVDPSVERRINLRAIDRFLTYGYLPGNETLFEGIFKLDPGHYLMVSDGKVTVRQYWDLRFEISPQWKRFDDAIGPLKDLLRRTVKDHMISDVPVGVLLSGGVDSTGVLRYAVEETSKPIHTFTMGFNMDGFTDERPYARIAAKQYGTVHQEITMTEKDFRDFLPKFIWHMEEPAFEVPAVALYFVSHLARESGIKVLLSGEGGDEAFGGYQNYRNLLLLENLKAVFGPAREILRVGLHLLGKAGFKRVGRYSKLINVSLPKYYLSRTTTPYWDFNSVKNTLYTKEFAEAIGRKGLDETTLHYFEKVEGKSLLNQMLYVDAKSWLPDDLLIKADKMTMATSIELRVPLLDHRVLEFAASLPSNFKVSGWQTKRILKAALSESVPQDILKRKKAGFPVPFDKWLHNKGMSDYISDTILAQNGITGSIFNKHKIIEILDLNRISDWKTKGIFCLLVLALWFKVFDPN